MTAVADGGAGKRRKGEGKWKTKKVGCTLVAVARNCKASEPLLLLLLQSRETFFTFNAFLPRSSVMGGRAKNEVKNRGDKFALSCLRSRGKASHLHSSSARIGGTNIEMHGCTRGWNRRSQNLVPLPPPFPSNVQSLSAKCVVEPLPPLQEMEKGRGSPSPTPLLLYFTQPIPFSPPSPSSSFPCGGFRAKKRRQRRRRDLTGGDGGRRREGETPPTKHSTTQISPSLFFLLPLRTTNQPPAEGNACI